MRASIAAEYAVFVLERYDFNVSGIQLGGSGDVIADDILANL